MPLLNFFFSTRRILSFILIGALLTESLPVSAANPGGVLLVDQRTVTYSWTVGLSCQAYGSCHDTPMPVRVGSGGYTLSRISSANDDGSVTVSEVVDYRTNPVSLESLGDGDFISGVVGERVPLETFIYRMTAHEGFDGRTVKVYNLDGNGIQDFMEGWGGTIGTAIEGAKGYLDRERANQIRQAEAVAELERRYQEGRQVNGQYVRAVDQALTAAASASAGIEGASWLHVGILAQNRLPDAEAVEAYQAYLALSQDPFAARTYVLNDVARGAIADQTRKFLRAKQYINAASEIESLQYAAKSGGGFEPLPSDLDLLQTGQGILKFETYDPSLPLSPLSEGQFKTKTKSDAGQIVRRVANRFQAVWAESRGLEKFSEAQKTQYVAGLDYLRYADHAIAEGKIEGSTALRVADALLKGAQGFSVGALNGVKDLVSLIPEVATGLVKYAAAVKDDPSQVLTSAANLLEALPAIKDALWQATLKAGDTVLHGSAYERGQLLGRIGFEVAVAYATAGTGRAFQALSAATKSAEGGGLAARAARIGEEIAEVAKMPRALKAQLATAALKSPALARDAIGGYRRFIQAAGEVAETTRLEAQKVCEVMLKTKNPNARSFLKSVISSQGTVGQEARYFKNAADAERIVQKYDRFWSAAKTAERGEARGFATRSVDSKFVSKSQAERAWSDHAGMYGSKGRFASGGPEGSFAKSVGYGKTAEQAERVSISEVRSYGRDPKLMTTYTKEIAIDDVLDFSSQAELKKFGFEIDDLVLARQQDLAYETPNIIGHVARRQGFKGILAPSAASKGGVVLHILQPGL